MSLTEDLNEAGQYTGSIFKRIGDFIILFIVSIIPIVDFIALGYYAKVARDSPMSKDAPKLERYGDMFIEGLKIFVIVIVWIIIIAIVAGIIAIPFIAIGVLTTLANPTKFVSGGWLFAAGIFAVIGVVVAFIVGIIAFMSVVHMMKKNSMGKAFAFSEILGVIGKIGWGTYLAFFIIAFIGLAIAGAISSAFGPLGWIVSALLSVLEGLFFFRTIGLMYDKATMAPQQAPIMQPVQ